MLILSCHFLSFACCTLRIYNYSDCHSWTPICFLFPVFFLFNTVIIIIVIILHLFIWEVGTEGKGHLSGTNSLCPPIEFQRLNSAVRFGGKFPYLLSHLLRPWSVFFFSSCISACYNLLILNSYLGDMNAAHQVTFAR